MYPSGTWRGYWEQEFYGKQAMQDFKLSFEDGKVKGGGHDVVGAFIFTGEYDDQGNITLIKRYIARHFVTYTGKYDGEGTIAGTWKIEPNWAGPFAMMADGVKPHEGLPVTELKPRKK